MKGDISKGYFRSLKDFQIDFVFTDIAYTMHYRKIPFESILPKDISITSNVTLSPLKHNFYYGLR